MAGRPAEATEPTPPSVEVRDVRPGRRFVLVVDGALAGTAEYRLDGEAVAFLHTQVDPAFEGRGLGSMFVREALRQLDERGVVVLPYCPFVRAYLQRHPELVHLVPAGRRAEFDLEEPAEP
jgi:predicted GNAT family acetyltransferase